MYILLITIHKHNNMTEYSPQEVLIDCMRSIRGVGTGGGDYTFPNVLMKRSVQLEPFCKIPFKTTLLPRLFLPPPLYIKNASIHNIDSLGIGFLSTSRQIPSTSDYSGWLQLDPPKMYKTYFLSDRRYSSGKG